tara:strand:- start:23738 stop:25345 length:1608 start_codon:yes stop_codon:yes gene_type:complete
MNKSIKEIALIVSGGTAASKVAGMIRQLVVAGAFGIGTAYDAYNYAYIIPGFFLIILGGINGPFHNAMVAVLSRKDEKEALYLSHSINTIITAILIIFSLIIITNSNLIISLVAPGLSNEIHKIAVLQLKIMAPIALFSGLIGIGFGSLNAKEKFLIPSISPCISSVIIIISIGFYSLTTSENNQTFDYALKGGAILAIATLIGAISQWIIQIPSLIKHKLFKFKLMWDFKNPGVKEVLNIILPATFSSGMLQINVFTDLFFASGIAGAAAALSYANFIVQAPLGLISNTIIIPLLPKYSKLFDSKNEKDLILKIRQGLFLSLASMIFLGVIFISLSPDIIELIYKRGVFDNNAVSLVSSLLIAYGIGMPAYLSRDLLVRIFYTFGDAKTPFKLSLTGIWLNIIFDWILIGGPTPWGNQIPFNFGVTGIVLATVIINSLTSLLLIIKLKSYIKNLPLKNYSLDLLKLIASGLITAIITFTISNIIILPRNFINLFLELSICFSIAFITFFLMNNLFKIKEFNMIVKMIQMKIIRF